MVLLKSFLDDYEQNHRISSQSVWIMEENIMKYVTQDGENASYALKTLGSEAGKREALSIDFSSFIKAETQLWKHHFKN